MSNNTLAGHLRNTIAHWAGHLSNNTLAGHYTLAGHLRNTIAVLGT